MRRSAFVVALSGALVLAACAGKPPAAAAQTASRLLSAAKVGDRVAFEAEIDRRAVREDLRRQMVELGAQKGLEVDGGPSDFALDRMIGPDAVRRMAAEALEAPTAKKLMPQLKTVGRERVCLRDAAEHDACLLTFAKVKRGWRLVGMQAREPAIQQST